jgi:hypothetical protein
VTNNVVSRSARVYSPSPSLACFAYLLEEEDPLSQLLFHCGQFLRTCPMVLQDAQDACGYKSLSLILSACVTLSWKASFGGLTRGLLVLAPAVRGNVLDSLACDGPAVYAFLVRSGCVAAGRTSAACGACVSLPYGLRGDCWNVACCCCTCRGVVC